MNRRRPMFLRPTHVVMGLCAILSLNTGFGSSYGLAVGVASPGGGGTKAASGTYSIKIGGFYTGTGQASVGSGAVHISATVVDEAGNTGLLRADVAVTTNRFKGTGTVMGQPIVIEGRVESADPQKRGTKRTQVQIGPRILATFGTADDHYGRVYGQPDHSQQP